ncbi:glycosyltransferase family 2 protein [Franconibacter helveticus 513]|uniref:glycosyltransferase family 2 protein n=1 Tax=Franconibacter helveticus TaxID=357240 RepID=UPI0004230923|nr:glycosyltransferase family 2 protein [Franconibacter helveticus]
MFNNSIKNHGIDVAVVIVTFNPELVKLKLLLAALNNKCNQIYLVDNNSNNVAEIMQISASQDTVTPIFNKTNLGIAAAQNQGIKLSIASGCSFTLLFDQDSLPQDDFIEKLVFSYYQINEFRKVSAIGPNLYDSRYDFNYSFVILNKYGFRKKFVPDVTHKSPVPVSCLIASGMLINNASISTIGLMNEELFIDYVDTEWCLRSKSLGYAIFMAPNVKLEHEIGDANFSFLSYRIPVHSPWRRYYRVRNGFRLLGMHHVPLLMSLREILFSLIHQAILFLNTKDKRYLNNYVKSIRDAFKKS